jgi:hypothetical protein
MLFIEYDEINLDRIVKPNANCNQMRQKYVRICRFLLFALVPVHDAHAVI